MPIFELEESKSFMIRVPHDKDIIKYLTKIVNEKNIRAGTFTAVGALKEAKVEFYDQESQEYIEKEVNKSTEIASCMGNVSILDGDSFVHAHAVLSDDNNTIMAGHLSSGRVFAAEINLRSFAGDNLVREFDPETGLSLWK